MAFATGAAAAAAIATGLAYLDAKLHISKDLQVFRARSLIQREFARAVAAKRISLYYFVEKQALDRGRAEAIWTRGGSHSWAEVLSRSHQYAQWFLARGVRPGNLVALVMNNSPDLIFAWVGLWAIGAAPAMINTHLAGAALTHCLAITGARLALVDGDSDLWGRISAIRAELEQKNITAVKLERGEVHGMPDTRPGNELREGVNPSSPMALFYTSGTTGLPKAVALPLVAGFATACGQAAGTNPTDAAKDRWFACMPYYHGTGGITTMSMIMAGTTVCVVPRFSASTFWRDVRDSRATWFVYVGETLRYLLAAPPSPLDRQHNVRGIWGNGLRPDVWRRFRERFGIEIVYEFFNSSEGMLALSNRSRNDFTLNAVGHHGVLQRRKYRNYLVPVAVDYETEEIARDPDTGFATRLPYEVGGEMLIAMPFERPFPGYWNNPEASEKKFVRDVFTKGDCYYRTGDALRRDAEGRWYFLDRLGDTFRWKGENVSTAEVSEVLGNFPGVIDATVYGCAIPGHDGKVGTAAVYIDPDRREAFNHAEFLKHARTHLPRYAVPVFLRQVTTPSSTHNNKQNKVPLKKDGVHPEKVGGGDQLLWIDNHGKGHTYVPFTIEDWDKLQVGKAKL